MKMEMSFPGGVAVQAAWKGFTIATDQPQAHGGGGTAPAPFDLFLASLGTCAGYYALRFCQERSISTQGLGLSLVPVSDPERHRVAKIQIEVRLPVGFPEKYKSAILRAVDQCAVKRALHEPPTFEVTSLAAEVPIS